VAVFDVATRPLKGRTWRGANMGLLRVDHPDIEKFIEAITDRPLNNFAFQFDPDSFAGTL
jgi:ribonucleoside-diphosphate reductase alpha chain